MLLVPHDDGRRQFPLRVIDLRCEVRHFGIIVSMLALESMLVVVHFSISSFESVTAYSFAVASLSSFTFFAF